jgi:urease accessory protein
MRCVKRVFAKDELSDSLVTSSVTLDYHDRYRRRLTLTDAQGSPFLLDLEKPRILREGDYLALDDGSVLAVHAAEEDVLDITSHLVTDTLRIAWHIGNRHTPLQVLKDGQIRIRWDPVLAKMVESLGARTHRHRAAFSPEGGAYAQPQGHGHDH